MSDSYREILRRLATADATETDHMLAAIDTPMPICGDRYEADGEHFVFITDVGYVLTRAAGTGRYTSIAHRCTGEFLGHSMNGKSTYSPTRIACAMVGLQTIFTLVPHGHNVRVESVEEHKPQDKNRKTFYYNDHAILTKTVENRGDAIATTEFLPNGDIYTYVDGNTTTITQNNIRTVYEQLHPRVRLRNATDIILEMTGGPVTFPRFGAASREDASLSVRGSRYKFRIGSDILILYAVAGAGGKFTLCDEK